MKIPVTEHLAIDDADIELHFIRASGPGGQNVNKVSSGVQLRYPLAGNPALPADVRERAIALAGRRLTGEGVIVIEATRFRSQERNRADATARLIELLARAATPPTPRRKTRPPASARVARLSEKRRRADTKRLRRAPGDQ